MASAQLVSLSRTGYHSPVHHKDGPGSVGECLPTQEDEARSPAQLIAALAQMLSPL